MFFILQAPYNEPFYFVVGDPLARQYFDVDSKTGEVFLKRSLLYMTPKEYKVSSQPIYPSNA